MPWVNGVYVPNRQAEEIRQSASITNAEISNLIELNDEQIEDNFFNESLLKSKFADGSFTASVLKKLLPSGVLSAANGLRALFSSGFVNSDLIEDGAVTGSKLTNAIKVVLINGGSAGTHTVSGIKTTDELISVLEQNGTSGILTDLTTEFSIVKADTIANPGGTATSSDKLIVMYLSK